MKVKDIMTKNVAYINPDASVIEAAQLMQKHNVGSVPVMDSSGIVGVVTDRDIVVRNIAHGKSPQDTVVRDIMTSQVATVTPDTDVDEMSELMSRHQIRRMPVIRNNTLVGIVALGDMATCPGADIEASEALSEISKPSKPSKM